MKLSRQNSDAQEDDYKTKNDDMAFFKPHPSGEVWRGLNYKPMEKLHYLIFLILFFAATSLVAQKPHFGITTEYEGTKYSLIYITPFEKIIAKSLRDEFPCADVGSSSEIRTRLGEMRDMELNGKDIPANLNNVGKDLPHDYWVYLAVHDNVDGKVQLEARCYKSKTVDCIADAGSLVASNNEGSVTDACKKLSKTFIDQLNQKEICAFKGPVSITVKSIKDSTELEEYGVYCNESDQQYRKKTVIKNSTISDWKLQRKGISWAEGTMTFTTNESTRITEENGCHKCKTGREGGRTYTNEKSFYIEGSGISHKSSFKGKPQEDTRIDLEFVAEGTLKYYIIAKGTSLPVTGEEKSFEEAQGTCDNIPRAAKSNPREVRIPLWVVFGPYLGRISDDVLQYKESKVITNLNGEKSTVTIDFRLSRKDQ